MNVKFRILFLSVLSVLQTVVLGMIKIPNDLYNSEYCKNDFFAAYAKNADQQGFKFSCSEQLNIEDADEREKHNLAVLNRFNNKIYSSLKGGQETNTKIIIRGEASDEDKNKAYAEGKQWGVPTGSFLAINFFQDVIMPINPLLGLTVFVGSIGAYNILKKAPSGYHNEGLKGNYDRAFRLFSLGIPLLVFMTRLGWASLKYNSSNY